MLLYQRMAVRNEDGCWSIRDRRKVGDVEDYEICPEGLQMFFDVPETAKRLWFSLHDRDSKFRYRATFCHLGWPRMELQNADGWNQSISEEGFDKIFERFVGKTLFLEVEYVE